MRNFLVIVFMAVTLSGCGALGTYNPATQRRELIFISTPEEISMGQKIHQQLMKEEKLSRNPALIARVNRIGQKLALVSDRQDYEYHFYVIEKSDLNAFTVPGGNIYIYTGLLEKLTTDDEVAAVLAHEIGHCSARHTIKKYQAALGYNFVGDIILNKLNLGTNMKQIASLSSDALSSLVFSAYSRSDEYQSDKLGLKYMDLAGYDLNGMVKSFEALEKAGEKGSAPVFLRSHPYISDRIRAVKEEIAQMGPAGGSL